MFSSLLIKFIYFCLKKDIKKKFPLQNYLINKIFKEKKIYKKYKTFLLRLFEYYIDKKRFTNVQTVALKRIIANG